MASKLAILLAAPSADEDDNPDVGAVEWCDHKLREVREALGHLLKIAKDAGLPTCPACEQAQQVYERLNPNAH